MVWPAAIVENMNIWPLLANSGADQATGQQLLGLNECLLLSCNEGKGEKPRPLLILRDRIKQAESEVDV